MRDKAAREGSAGAAGTSGSGTVLVVGAGIAGMQAALDLADGGYAVHLVTTDPSVGGRMSQLDKTFPTNDCAMCLLGPRMTDTGRHPNITLHTCSTLVGLEGEPGAFLAHIRKAPRYVDVEDCTACGECAEVCPVELPDRFNVGMTGRKAIHKYFPQAVPNAYLISKAGTPPCRNTCPAQCNVQGYTALIAQGRFAEALEVARRRIPFPGICGRICHHPCESKCNRADIDEPVAIHTLKRAAFDFGREDLAKASEAAEAASGAAGGAAGAHPGPADITRKEKVAVVGAGPAGLTAALDLVEQGFEVTVYDQQAKPGGMLRYGIPRYRLPVEIVDEETDWVLRRGVKFVGSTRVGEDVTIDGLLRDGFAAVIVATGVQKGRSLPLEGMDAEGVYLGMEFLKAAAKLGTDEEEAGRAELPDLEGKRVLVVGGGNVAVDTARTALRLGAREVHMACLESRTEMPAHEWEVEEALEEGVVLHPSWGPKRVLTRDEPAGRDGDADSGRAGGGGGRRPVARGLEMLVCTRVFDDEGRFSPELAPGTERVFEADVIILSVGQAVDRGFERGSGGDALAGLELTPGGYVVADRLTGATGNPAVFACGDISTGPASVVEAIAAGHEAAESVRRYLDGVDLAEGRTLERPESVPSPDRPVEARPRVREKAADPEARRRDFREVLQGLSREEAMEEAKRCLQCGDCCECLQCVAKCEKKAIDHDARPEEVELSVGAVILAPGYELFDAAGAGEYGYGVYPNVVTSMEFERLLSSTGPTQGHIERPSDGRPPRRIAFIQCVGSRDVGCGAEYCSSVCCMYSAKEAVIAREHDPDVSATVFFLDVRAYGKNFDRYVDSAREDYGVRFIRSFVSGVREDPETRNLLITYVEDGEVKEEEFDLVVLAVGVRPPEAARELAEAAGIELDEHGFALTGELEPNQTTRAGVFVAGAFQGPMDIPESVMNGSAAAASAERLLAAGRGRDVRPKEYPPERDVSGEEPRVGVFICRCGINIASVVDVGSVVEFASKLPGVVWAEELLYTCSQDSLKHIKEVIRDEGLNRVVVSSCTIRTHQLLFRETLRECGLNQFYFEMANIRDQCSWVHRTDPAAALEKAKDLVKAAVAKVKTHEALELRPVPVVQKALVIGGGPAGMTAALEIAGMGYDVYLVEQESELGGNLRRIRRTVGGADVGAYLRDLVGRVEAEPRIEVLTGARVEEFSGHAGHFKTTVSVPATLKAVGGSGGPGRRTRTLEHGVVIVATGVRESVPREHLYGEDPRVLTGLEFEERLEEAGGEEAGDGLPDTAVFIQCVGSRNEERRYCSRTCCVETLKNALRLKELKPEARVYVLYRDMRSYGLYERYYRQAREAGVVFVNYDERAKPEVTVEGAAGGAAAAGSGGGAPAGRLKVKVRDRATGFELAVHPDNVILAAAADPAEGAQALGTLLKVPLNDDGFFLETHIKLAPMDFPSNGIYLCGAGHSPKFIAEAVYQARGAAARAATILSRENMMAGGVVASVDERFCAACLTCVRACPFQVPKINERGVAEISPVQCMGCGTCAAECPGKAIQLANYKDVQLAAKVAGMYARVSD